MYNDTLYHSGVKGMRWGVRRNQPPTGSKSNPRKKVTRPARKHVSEMSDDELKTKLSRLDMEKRYNQHMKDSDPFKRQKVEKFLGHFLDLGVNIIFTAAVTKIAQKLISSK